MHHFSTKAISGIIIFIAGLLCFMFPMMGALDVEAMLGVLILLAGIFHLVGSLEERSAVDFTWNILTSCAFLGFGVFLVADPYRGVEVLALVMFLFLAIHGILGLIAAFTQKSSHKKWYWTAFSGVVSLLISAMIFFGYPFGDQWTVGMLSGVAILAYGMALVVTSGVVKDQ